MAQTEYVGPFSHYDVVVGGRVVPLLTATLPPGGKVHLTLDRRLGLTLTAAEAERFVPWLADVIAVAMGYTCHPGEDMGHPIERHPFPRVKGIAWAAPEEEASDGAK